MQGELQSRTRESSFSSSCFPVFLDLYLVSPFFFFPFVVSYKSPPPSSFLFLAQHPGMLPVAVPDPSFQRHLFQGTSRSDVVRRFRQCLCAPFFSSPPLFSPPSLSSLLSLSASYCHALSLVFLVRAVRDQHSSRPAIPPTTCPSTRPAFSPCKTRIEADANPLPADHSGPGEPRDWRRLGSVGWLPWRNGGWAGNLRRHAPGLGSPCWPCFDMRAPAKRCK